ncbi:MAG: NAD(P)/FAD-dependent oxidoreductase [Zavarzinella sp.]
MSDQLHHVVIVGGGFAGIAAAQALRKAPVRITMIDRRNFHLFQPLLYQVATGGLSPANIAAPLRGILRKQKNCTVLLGEVQEIDLSTKQVIMDGAPLAYDSLIVAAGAVNNYFGNNQWESVAPGLKSVEDATRLRAKILHSFEAAERLDNLSERQKLLTFVVVGGGPTGVELAGSIAELAHHTMRNDFRNIDPTTATVYLVEAGPRVLSMFPEKLSGKAAKALHRIGVQVMTSAKVLDIQTDHVKLEHNQQHLVIPCNTVAWGAGVIGSPLGKILTTATGGSLARGGRVPVNPDLTLPNHSEVFVIGDLAAVNWKDTVVPGVAPAAIQMGKYAGWKIATRLAGKQDDRHFSYWDKGSMATIGRNAAVADAGFIYMSGRLAWLAWLFIHILYLIQFSNRVLVMWQWFWNYFTRNRSARLITGEIGNLPPKTTTG